jgi:hypothetical protein
MLSFIILYITNPTQDDFTNFYDQKISKEQKDATISSKILLEGKKMYLMMNVDRKDRYIYSVYTIELSGEKEVYIGIVKNFILKDKVKKAESGAINTYKNIVKKTGNLLEKGSNKVEELVKRPSE